MVRIEGLKEAREALANLSKTVGRNAGKRALQKPAAFMVQQLKAAAPVSTDPYNRSKGSLRASVEELTARAEKSQPRVAIIIEDPAAAAQEFGNSRQRAYPFARDTFDRNRSAAAVIFAPEIKAEIEAAAERVAKRAARGK